MQGVIRTASLERQIKLCQKSLAAALRHGRANTATSLKNKLDKLLHAAQLAEVVHQRDVCSTAVESSITGNQQVAPTFDDGDEASVDNMSFFEVQDEPTHARNLIAEGLPLHVLQKKKTNDKWNTGVGNVEFVGDKRSRRTRRRERRLHLLDQAPAIHPSWEAARVARSKIMTARFCGKRTKFINKKSRQVRRQKGCGTACASKRQRPAVSMDVISALLP